jgi:hypothetical protein
MRSDRPKQLRRLHPSRRRRHKLQMNLNRPMQTFTEARHIAREKSLLDYPEANQPTA